MAEASLWLVPLSKPTRQIMIENESAADAAFNNKESYGPRGPRTIRGAAAAEAKLERLALVSEGLAILQQCVSNQQSGHRARAFWLDKAGEREHRAFEAAKSYMLSLSASLAKEWQVRMAWGSVEEAGSAHASLAQAPPAPALVQGIPIPPDVGIDLSHLE
jgi:hypothetical protein